MVPKNTIFAERCWPKNQGVHFWKLYNKRFRKFKNGVGVGVDLAYGAKYRGIKRSSSSPEQKNRYLKVIIR